MISFAEEFEICAQDMDIDPEYSTLFLKVNNRNFSSTENIIKAIVHGHYVFMA